MTDLIQIPRDARDPNPPSSRVAEPARRFSVSPWAGAPSQGACDGSPRTLAQGEGPGHVAGCSPLQGNPCVRIEPLILTSHVASTRGKPSCLSEGLLYYRHSRRPFAEASAT